MENLELILNFIQANQILVAALAMVASFLLKLFIDRQATKNTDGTFAKLKPQSDKLYAIVHQGIEYWATGQDYGSEAKLATYKKVIEDFNKTWKKSKLAAIEELAAWYFSQREKAGDVKKLPLNPS